MNDVVGATMSRFAGCMRCAGRRRGPAAASAVTSEERALPSALLSMAETEAQLIRLETRIAELSDVRNALVGKAEHERALLLAALQRLTSAKGAAGSGSGQLGIAGALSGQEGCAGEVQRCWCTRQAAGGGECGNSSGDAAPGVSGSGAAFGGTSELAAGDVGGAVRGGQAAAHCGDSYGAATIAHCAAVLRGQGKLVPSSDALLVQAYRNGRGVELIALACRPKNVRTCARCALHDTATLGGPTTHVFRKEKHNCPYAKPEHAMQCPICVKAYKRHTAYNKGNRRAVGS